MSTLPRPSAREFREIVALNDQQTEAGRLVAKLMEADFRSVRSAIVEQMIQENKQANV